MRNGLLAATMMGALLLSSCSTAEEVAKEQAPVVKETTTPDSSDTESSAEETTPTVVAPVSDEDVCTAVKEDLAVFEGKFQALGSDESSLEDADKAYASLGELMVDMGEDSNIVQLTSEAETTQIHEDAKDLEALLIVSGHAALKGIESTDDIDKMAELQDEVSEEHMDRLMVIGLRTQSQSGSGDPMEGLFEDCHELDIQVFPLLNM